MNKKYRMTPLICMSAISNRIVMIIKIDIPWSSSIVQHETLVTLWSLVLAVPGQHALYTHANALHILHGTPALGAQKVEADDAVRVDVGVHWDRSIRGVDERHLWGFNGIAAAEFEFKTVGLVHV